MVRTTEKAGRTMESKVETGYEALMHANENQLSAAMKANESMLNGMTVVGQEIMDFANSRLQQDIAISEKLAKSKDANSAFCIQCEFAQTALQQYFEESHKLMTLGTKIAQDCWTPWQDRTTVMLKNFSGR